MMTPNVYLVPDFDNRYVNVLSEHIGEFKLNKHIIQMKQQKM